jgi:hypothetical protein
MWIPKVAENTFNARLKLHGEEMKSAKKGQHECGMWKRGLV